MRSKIQDLGLVINSRDDKEIKTCLKLHQMLVFLPPGDVIPAFEELKKIVIQDERVINFYDYFEKNYIGEIKTRRGRYNKVMEYREEPLFEINLWNVHARTQMCLPRTNNYCESWHHSFSKMVNNHPVIYQLIYAIINEEKRIQAKIIK